MDKKVSASPGFRLRGVGFDSGFGHDGQGFADGAEGVEMDSDGKVILPDGDARGEFGKQAFGGVVHQEGGGVESFLKELDGPPDAAGDGEFHQFCGVDSSGESEADGGADALGFEPVEKIKERGGGEAKLGGDKKVHIGFFGDGDFFEQGAAHGGLVLLGVRFGVSGESDSPGVVSLEYAGLQQLDGAVELSGGGIFAAAEQQEFAGADPGESGDHSLQFVGVADIAGGEMGNGA